MSDFARKLAQTKEAILARDPGGGVRLFFEPRPCDDPKAFARQCQAEAGKAQAVVVRFVRPPEPSQGSMQ